ncbi:MAG TPA: methionyl-tRNA formyltransferase [Longimicrobiales bacterium]
MRVLFWGTPLFAVPSLRALTEEGHDVVGVVTQPDRPAGRGRRLTPSPVKEVALEDGLHVMTPDPPRGEDFLAGIRALEPDASVVVAYGHILRREVLDVPRLGSFNVHASLLPALRGAAPVNWAIIRGHETSGVTVMRMVEAMDAGPILLQEEEPIGATQTATELASRLSEVGAVALVEALALLSVGAVAERDQDEARATYAPKVDRDTARIDWSASAREVADLVRGMDETPGAWSVLDGSPVKLFAPRPETGASPSSADGPEAGDVGGGATGPAPGTVVSRDPSRGIAVAAGSGVVWFGEVQPPGRRRMLAGDWLHGRGVEEGRRFV